ncbi:putative receptor-like protein kinase [Sesamum alatum]|uniref:non-specific serine/threonine protein kinase n=1 Tax=Sesamum alatum TaxID=300844 RepID=A0AAE2CPD3_9LAMI|nr:putative receptor-like protein kinase [Sesamum alatum]
MSKSHVLFPFLPLIFFFTHFCTNQAADSVCPIKFDYVATFPWDTSLCREPVQSACCQTLRSVFGMGLAHYLKETSMFYLPDANTSSSCMANFQEKLVSMSFPDSLFPVCFNDTTEFANRPSTSCAGIVTVNDWTQRVYTYTPLESSCNGDLTGLTRCSLCVDAGLKVNSYLVSLHPNSTKCFFFAILYAAAIVNDYGPEDARTASCILGLPLSSSANGKGSTNNTKRRLLFGVMGGVIGTCFAVILFLVYRQWDKKKKQDQMHETYVHSMKSRVLPNSGAKWFHVAELEQATDGFSQKNMIGKGGFGVVYKGTLSDGTEVAVKQILDLESKGDHEFTNEAEIISKIRHRNLLALRGFCVTKTSKILITDWAWALVKSGRVEEIFQESIRNQGPKGVMERFVRVGLLCAHVMVALRPTIADALKMLEGDIDIPRLPERPLPLTHETLQMPFKYSSSTSEGSRAKFSNS